MTAESALLVNIHKEVVTKVNALVDEAILPLVDQLTEMGAQTLHSCQGNGNMETAYVSFEMGREVDPALDFFTFVTCRMNGRVNATCQFEVRTHSGGPSYPRMVLRMSLDDIEAVVAVLKNPLR